LKAKPRDLWLYGAIGGLQAAQGCVSMHMLPDYLAAPILIASGVVLAIKAKLSGTDPKDPAQTG
jgi:hypothetical protein